MSTTLPPPTDEFVSLRDHHQPSVDPALPTPTGAAADEAVPPGPVPLEDRLRATWLRLGQVRPETWVGLAIVAACVGFVFYAAHPKLILADTTPTGGDMGSHVWGPRYLADHLLPHWRISGWTPDWYAGFPAYRFYMVVPSLLIVALATGFTNPVYLVVAGGAAAAIAASGFIRPDLHLVRDRWRWWLVALGAVVLVLSVPITYNVSFKLIVVLGLVTLPIAAYAFGRLSDLPFPTPPLLAVAAVFFLFNREPSYNGYANIIGGNFGSTMAGEFAFSISLSLAVLYLGVLVRGLRTGRNRAWASALLALTVLCHLIPGIFAVAATAAVFAVRPNRARLRWLATVLPVGGLLTAIWTLPLLGARQLMNDMGWEKLPAVPPDVQDKFGLWFTTETSNGVEFYGRWYYLAPPNLRWVLWLALAGVVVSVVRRRTVGAALAVVVAMSAVAFVLLPEGRLWNTRLLPFLFLACFFLAAIAIGELISMWGGFPRGYRPAPGPVAVAGVVVLALAAWTLVLLPDSDASLIGTLDDVHLVPVLYLLVLAAAGVGAAGILYAVARVARSRVGADRLIGPAVAVALGLAGLAVVAFPLDKVPFAHRGIDGTVRWPAAGPDGGERLVSQAYQSAQTQGAAVPARQPDPPPALFDTEDTNAVSSWARWNFSGLERKGDPWTEFSALIATMDALGQDPEHGCGRAMWEYDGTREGSYGTPMALMMFPHFTDGCIGSMEGLYFESSSTTPFHFINQTELSTQPSSSQRDLPYNGFNMEQGIEHLQMLGVRYYLADTNQSVAAATQNPDLTEVAVSGPWHIYELSGSELVTPVRNEPVVMANVEPGQDSWLPAAMDWYTDPTAWDVPVAIDGPEGWERVQVTERPEPDQAPGEPAPQVGSLTDLPELPRRAVRETRVTNVVESTDGISFDVDRPGAPVLVKVSYFPNFEASGAEGPWRVAPNLMVVIPTDRHVEVRYGRTGVDWLAILLTLAGIGLLVLLARRPPVAMPAGRWWWTRDPGDDFVWSRASGEPDGPAPAAVALADTPSSPRARPPVVEPDRSDGVGFATGATAGAREVEPSDDAEPGGDVGGVGGGPGRPSGPHRSPEG